MPDPAQFPAEVVTAGVATVDGCPVLGRTKAFLVDQGTAVTLEHAVTGRDGRPVDLSRYAGPNDSFDGVSYSSQTPGGSVKLRVSGVDVSPHRSCVREFEGVFWLPASGVVRAPLDVTLTGRAGLYQLSWGVFGLDGNLGRVSTALLSVEPTLFGSDLSRASGPPSLAEIRTAVRDSAPGENLLLQTQEFGDDQIVEAVVRPLRYFNEQPPPIRPFTAADFPFREMWLRATAARLYDMAAAGYRRNQLPYQAGGVAVDDQNKEQPYLAAAQALEAEWQQFVRDKKLQINHAAWTGSVGSFYGTGRDLW